MKKPAPTAGFSSGGSPAANSHTGASPDGGGNSYSFNAQYSNLDQKQTTRATLGNGTVTVRDDQATGNDSTAGLNRDITKAQEVTKDKSTNIDAYYSSSAMESVEGLFKTNDAGNNVTLSRWQGEIEHFGRNTVLTYQNMGALATHEDVPEPLRAIAGFMNDAGDTLGVLTLGLAPGVENHGGLTGGIAAIATGDQFFYAVQTRTSTNSKNEFVLDSYSSSGEVDHPSEGKTVFTNGIQNSLEEAIRNGAMQTGSDDFIMAYNPEHGLLGDLLESFWDKNIGGVVASGNARQLTSFYQAGIDNNTNFNIAAHSQGTLLNYRAMDGLDFTNGGTKETGTVQFSGSPVSAAQFQRLVENTGFAFINKDTKQMDYSNTVFQINRPEGETSLFGRPLVDSVADSIGGNYQYGEGGSLSGAIFSLPFLFTDKSPHSNYVCQTEACLKAPSSVAVEDFKSNLRTPDTDGKGYIKPKVIKLPLNNESQEETAQEHKP